MRQFAINVFENKQLLAPSLAVGEVSVLNTELRGALKNKVGRRIAMVGGSVNLRPDDHTVPSGEGETRSNAYEVVQ